jgi:hypothetical protein
MMATDPKTIPKEPVALMQKLAPTTSMSDGIGQEQQLCYTHAPFRSFDVK